MSAILTCPLCHAPDTRRFSTVADADRTRTYDRCDVCGLTFLIPSDHLTRAAARAHYDTHENRIDDPGYRMFLARLADPLTAHLKPGSRGIDYGCGPGPALAAMLSEAGHTTALYDPFYQPDRSVLDATYDFVTCTEVAEHFCDPATEFARLNRLLRPGGLLGLMTCFQTDDAAFARWHYRADPTHVCFYSEATLGWLAARYDCRLTIPRKDVALFAKA